MFIDSEYTYMYIGLVGETFWIIYIKYKYGAVKIFSTVTNTRIFSKKSFYTHTHTLKPQHIFKCRWFVVVCFFSLDVLLFLFSFCVVSYSTWLYLTCMLFRLRCCSSVLTKWTSCNNMWWVVRCIYVVVVVWLFFFFFLLLMLVSIRNSNCWDSTIEADYRAASFA